MPSLWAIPTRAAAVFQCPAQVGPPRWVRYEPVRESSCPACGYTGRVRTLDHKACLNWMTHAWLEREADRETPV